MIRLYALIRSLLVHEEAGQSLAEYILMLVLIAIVAIASLLFFGKDVNQILLNSDGVLG